VSNQSDRDVANRHRSETEQVESETGTINRLLETTKTDIPVVGLAVPPGTAPETVAGAVLRARQNDHLVIACAIKPIEEETKAFLRELEVPYLIHEQAYSSISTREFMIKHVRKTGYPGLLWQDDPATHVDFQRSVEELQTTTEYAVEVCQQPAVSPEQRVLVAIPAYNEADSIAEVVDGALPYADDVLVIDDGSEDETAARAREAGATVVEHSRNQGYGAALKTAFREAERSGAEQLVILDGDGQHDPSDVARLAEHQRETDAEIVIGCRFGEDAETDLPLYRRCGLAVVNVLTNLSLGVVRPSSRVRDTQSGFRCYNREAIESLATDEAIGDHMGASTDILHHAHSRDYDIEEVGTTVRYNVENANNQNSVQHGMTLVSNVLQTIEHERPMLILGLPGLIATLLGIWLGYWTFSNFLTSGTFPTGLAVASTFFALIGVFTGFTAIILHTLKQYLGDLNGANGA